MVKWILYTIIINEVTLKSFKYCNNTVKNSQAQIYELRDTPKISPLHWDICALE